MTEPRPITRSTFSVDVRRNDDSTLWCEVKELPGCFATGDDLAELRLNLAESIGLYLYDDPEAVTISSGLVPPAFTDEVSLEPA